MALPTKEKTYQFSVNRWTTTEATTTKDKDIDTMLWMKNTLLGWSSSPWTVYQSCDGVTAGTEGDGVDRWQDTGDIVLNTEGNAHSWFVWDLPVGSCQLCFNCYNVSRTAQLVFSPEGRFSGGTVTNRPTADDETVTTNQEWNDGNYVAPYQCVNHLISSTDGKFCCFFANRNHAVSSMWCFFEASDPESGWTAPYCFFRLDAQDTETVPIYNALIGAQNWIYGGAKVAYTGGAGTTFSFKFAAEGAKLTSRFTQPQPAGLVTGGRNNFSGEFALYPLVVVSFDLGAEGPKGYLADVYLTPDALPTGFTLEDDPVNPTREWAVFGNIAVPWNGSVPIVG